jgi:hypothetical protein
LDQKNHVVLAAQMTTKYLCEDERAHRVRPKRSQKVLVWTYTILGVNDRVRTYIQLLSFKRNVLECYVNLKRPATRYHYVIGEEDGYAR